jgi:hypothetical protein
VVAEITNAVLEGGDPFPLTVRSSFGTPLTNGNYQFMGDYLQDLYPSGTQYLFDWTFAGTNNGEAVWNGIIGWAGGHAWYVVISNITLVPVSRLEISQGTAGSVEVTWPTNFTYDVLEYATRLPATNWDLVTNAVSTVGSRFSVTLGTTAAQQYFRLRRP